MAQKTQSSQELTDRPRGRPKGISPQGEQTRERLYAQALALIEAEGYHQATMRKLATRAKVSPGLLYKYYPNKAAVVLELYDRLSRQFTDQLGETPPGDWQKRVTWTTQLSLEVLRPHREPLIALIPILVSNSDQSLFGSQTRFSRERVQRGFEQAISSATNSPDKRITEAITRLMYLFHLGVILLWLLDRSKNQVASTQLIKLYPKVLWWIGLAIKFKKSRSLLNRLDQCLKRALFDLSGG